MSKKREAFICKMALANPTWGADTISQRLLTLSITLSDTGVSDLLKRNGIPPAPEREKTNDWSRFLETHWPHLFAIDCATFEIPDEHGKRTHRCHALYAIKLSTREVHLLGVRMDADGKWTTQMARNACDIDYGFMMDGVLVIMDRDPLFRGAFRDVLESSGITCKILPAKSPNLNAYIERFIGTVRREIGKNFVPLSEDHLKHRLTEHVKFYNLERTHQGRDDLLMPDQTLYDSTKNNTGPIKCRSRLGNTLNYYYREAV